VILLARFCSRILFFLLSVLLAGSLGNSGFVHFIPYFANFWIFYIPKNFSFWLIFGFLHFQENLVLVGFCPVCLFTTGSMDNRLHS